MFLQEFVAESNRIEGIHRVTEAEVDAHRDFLREAPSINRLTALVQVCAPGHVLRDRPGLNVRVGDHVAPEGGDSIPVLLNDILSVAGHGDPHKVHCAHEDLHPFTDGNGRSGRALWLWMMLNRGGRDAQMATTLGFLHSFYYQTLSRSDGRVVAE